MCMCVCKGAGKEEGGYMLTCAMRIDPTWPPYAVETRMMVGYKATPPVPALYISSSRTSITAVHVGGKTHLLDRLNIRNLYCGYSTV